MKRTLLLALPLLALAVGCSKPASDDSASTSADIVGTESNDFADLESSLGLVHDDDRTRDENVVKNGPCYKSMDPSGKGWDMRRYTTGAAFFATDANGDPAGPVTCVDIDVAEDDTGGSTTAGLDGELLDLALRLPFGKLIGTTLTGTAPPASTIRGFDFEHGSIVASSPHDCVAATSACDQILSSNQYGTSRLNKAVIGEVSGWFVDPGMPHAPWTNMPVIESALTEMAHLAYRYAKARNATTANDPLGKLTRTDSIKPNSPMLLARYEADFEKGTMWFDKVSVAGQISEEIQMNLTSGGAVAYCSRSYADGAPAPSFECRDNEHPDAWEQPGMVADFGN